MTEGKCIIFSAPSGAGKTTIVHYLLEQELNLSFSISACTRQKRENEIDGVDYHFYTVEAFKEKIADGSFVEWEEVYHDHFYGTLHSEIKRIWESGHHVIFDVDVVGGLKLKEYFGEKALAIFVMPPDIATLEKRLRNRATENEERLIKRVEKAEIELNTAHLFDEVIVNDDLKKALMKAKQLVMNFLKK